MTRKERERNPEAYEKYKAKQRELMRKRRAENPEIRKRDVENAIRWQKENPERYKEIHKKVLERQKAKKKEE